MMARTAVSHMRDLLLPRLQQLYRRGQPVQYQQVDDAENNNNNNNDYTNNNYSSVNNNLLDLPSPATPSLRRWQRWSRNIIGLPCLFVPTPRSIGTLAETPAIVTAEVCVLQVALVTMGRHIGLLNNWYCLPEGDQAPPDSVLFPLSTHLLTILKTLAADLSEVGAWCSMPAWWYSLEMRKLRLRHNIKGLYLYDTHTEEQMLLYKPGHVTMHSQYTRTSTIASRLEVWIL